MRLIHNQNDQPRAWRCLKTPLFFSLRQSFYGRFVTGRLPCDLFSGCPLGGGYLVPSLNKSLPLFELFPPWSLFFFSFPTIPFPPSVRLPHDEVIRVAPPLIQFPPRALNLPTRS